MSTEFHFEDAIRQALALEIEKASKSAIEAAKQDLERRLAEVVAGVAVKVAKYVSLERHGMELLIHVKTDNWKET